MSMFGNLDIESAADDPFALPDNTYKAVLTEVKVGPSKNGDKTVLSLIFTVQSEDEHDGKTIREWKVIPTPNDPKNLSDEEKRNASFLKRRMLDLGIPPERINTLEPDDLIGKEVYVTTVSKSDGAKTYVNVRKVTLVESGLGTVQNTFQ